MNHKTTVAIAAAASLAVGLLAGQAFGAGGNSSAPSTQSADGSAASSSTTTVTAAPTITTTATVPVDLAGAESTAACRLVDSYFAQVTPGMMGIFGGPLFFRFLRDGAVIPATSANETDKLEAIAVYWPEGPPPLTSKTYLTEWNPADYSPTGAGYVPEQRELPDSMRAQTSTFNHVFAAGFCGSVHHAAGDISG